MAKEIRETREESKEFDSAIWVEKYRPRDFKDIAGQDEIVSRIQALVAAKNLPHLLFSGPAGTGKTTLALVIAKKLFSKTWHENFLELNASDERGIDVVREKVKSFARIKSMGEVPFKIILLDESDALTKDAQNALRRIMEKYTQTCRFILSCNASSKIIDPIQSRCAVFRFRMLEKKDVIKVINKIIKDEKIRIDDKALDVLYNESGGDLRRAINILQASSGTEKNITDSILYEIISEAKPQEIKMILETAIKGNFVSARDRLLELMAKKGFNGLDVVKEISKEIFSLGINEDDKIKLMEKCGEIEFRLIEGSDDFIQIQALLASFLPKNK